MATPEVPVNPAVLVWARKSASASMEQAAKKAGVELARLQAWESGTEKPTVAQLRHLAELYKRPFALFLLDQVPKTFTVMKSFRRVPDSDDLALSFALASQLRQALQRRDVALELAPEVGEEPKKFTEKAALSEDPAHVAERIRTILGIATAVQEGWKDDYEAFRAWRQALEALGILAFQASGVDVEEARGLSTFFPVFPLVLLNSGDAVRARIFTLAHELGHLLLHSEARLDPASVLDDPNEDEEVWCNEFAGALLVPLAALSWPSQGRSPEDFDWGQLKAEANRFKVSREVILRRLLTGARLTKKQYQELRRELQKRTPPRSPSDGFPPQHVKVISRLGVPFVKTVVSAYRMQKITLSDVSDYLDVRVKYVPDIEDRVMRVGYAGGEEA